MAAALLGTQPLPASAQPPEFHGFYLLSFGRYGQLLSPYERDLAISELARNPDVERILLVAYGWANDGETSLGAYEKLLGDQLARLRSDARGGRTAIIGIGWDSSQTGFRKLANNLIPLPVLADAIAWLPDRALFPLSFWSKAAMADRIGFGGLRQTLNEIFAAAYPEGRAHPDLYLVGHSFGTRILSALVKERIGLLSVGTEPFQSTRHVRGALWMQPALVLANLPQDPPFPMIVTQSEHDHANGMVFPVGNVVVNAYAFTAFEALIQKQLFAAVEDTVGTASETVLGAGSLILRWPGQGKADGDRDDLADDASSSAPGVADLPVRAYLATRRTGAELLSIPITAGFTALATPFQYAYTQWIGLTTRPVDHVLDSLAQLPVLEVGVDLASRVSGREVPWGRSSKGFFSLGALHESAGRLIGPAPWLPPAPEPVPYAALFDVDGLGPCGLPRCQGVVFVDLSDEVGAGQFGDLRNPWIAYTVGWLDLVGMHSRSREPEMAMLLSRLLFGAEASVEAAPPGDMERSVGAP